MFSRVLCLMLAGCNTDKNLTIWALNSIEVISTTGGNLTQAWIKVNCGKLPDNLRINHNNNGNNKALWMTSFNNLCKHPSPLRKTLKHHVKGWSWRLVTFKPLSLEVTRF
ncbi:hypothetical protein LR48_Vigan208s000800 [Vigna angularis]|uniref:Uncharacterized protein n=1 Tax=Phaseolus angularis TaxID=3914 RepID=A0A0L9T5V4_PHAAN|nr:hypothetical protein LR48_Vigan208s000800 [Vigna angularis]